MGPINIVWVVLVLVCVVCWVWGCFVWGVVFVFVSYLLVMVCRVCFSWLVRVVGFCFCLVRRVVRYLLGVRVLLCVCPMHLFGCWYFFVFCPDDLACVGVFFVDVFVYVHGRHFIHV